MHHEAKFFITFPTNVSEIHLLLLERLNLYTSFTTLLMLSFICDLAFTCKWLRALELFHTGLRSGSRLAAMRRCSDRADQPLRCNLDHTDTLPRWSNCLPHSGKTHCRPGTYRGLPGQLKSTKRGWRRSRWEHCSVERGQCIRATAVSRGLEIQEK